MSSYFVRESVRQWCNDVSLVVGIPFYDTINLEKKPTEDVWFTVEFLGLERDGTYCADDFAESGFVTLIVVARPGIGDAAAVQGIEAIIDELHTRKNEQVSLLFPEPFFEDSFGSADQDYRVGALLPYFYSNQ